MIFPFLYIFAASLVTLILWWAFKKSHIKMFSQNATTLREVGYWFIPEALIRKTGSQHKVFPSFYSNEAEFALWSAALILEMKKGGKMRFSDQIDLGNGALRSWQAESERLLFDHSGRSQWGRGRVWRDGVSLCCERPPYPSRMYFESLRCSIIQLFLALGSL